MYVRCSTVYVLAESCLFRNILINQHIHRRSVDNSSSTLSRCSGFKSKRYQIFCLFCCIVERDFPNLIMLIERV